MFSMLGKEGIICVPSSVSSLARAFGQQICDTICMCYRVVLDSNGPIIQFKSMSLKQKQTTFAKLMMGLPNQCVCSQHDLERN